MHRAIPLFLLLASSGAARQDAELEKVEFFEKKIRPVLSERCYRCHSARGEAIKGGLSLDSREAVLRGGAGGPAVIPGDPEKSPLIKAIRYVDDELQMPPKGKLSAAIVADFESWVRMGVPAPAGKEPPPPSAKAPLDLRTARQFWSLRPIASPSPPAVQDPSWAATPVDTFILARLEEKGLRPTGDADRRSLLRRVSFDLIGLPPSPEEVEAFEKDDAPDAYDKVLERLLASPHYGERWGRVWLDLVRYADTAGDNADYPVPQAYRYRDYVIAAFNKDKPYDEFLREQLAGDLLPSATEEQRYERIVATGFVAVARRFGLEPEADIHLTIDDTIDTLGRAVLGLSLGCARCHDHKFDPIPTEDYYALYGIFQSTRYPFPGGERMKYQKDFVPLLPREKAEALFKPFEEKYAALEAELLRLKREVEEAATRKEDPEGRKKGEQLKKSLGDVTKKRAECVKERPEVDDAYALSEGTPSNARIHLKGNPRSPGQEVPRGFLQVLGGQTLAAGATGSGRMELAEWLVDPSNPLTARVLVNRLWQRHFGRGLVGTPSDFGRQGLAPTHPELLDYLASAFVRSGWSIKEMQRLILRSRTYRLASVGRPENLSADPTNERLWRFPRRRLDAEAIRDAILDVSGGLDRTIGGPHPFPARSTWGFSQATPFYAVYPTKRRSVYLMQQRLKKHPYLCLFDGADTNSSTASRSTTTTALQALFMMNSPFVRDAARRWAERLLQEVPDDDARIDRAHRLAFGRPPTADELGDGRQLLRTLGGGLRAWESYARVLLSTNEFLFID